MLVELPKLINKAELARCIYPDSKGAPQMLNDKLKNVNRHTLSDDDKKCIIESLRNLLVEVESLFKNIPTHPSESTTKESSTFIDNPSF